MRSDQLSLLAEVEDAIRGVRSAHDNELRRLTNLCCKLPIKTADGKLNATGLDLVDRMLKAGLQNKDIAAALNISRPAVTRHFKHHAQSNGLMLRSTDPGDTAPSS